MILSATLLVLTQLPMPVDKDDEAFVPALQAAAPPPSAVPIGLRLGGTLVGAALAGIPAALVALNVIPLCHQSEDCAWAAIGPAIIGIPLATATGAFLFHRLLGGRGPWFAAMIGAAAGFATSLMAGAGILSAVSRRSEHESLIIGGMGVVTVAATLVALELGHRIQVGLAPTPGGATVALGGTF